MLRLPLFLTLPKPHWHSEDTVMHNADPPTASSTISAPSSYTRGDGRNDRHTRQPAQKSKRKGVKDEETLSENWSAKPPSAVRRCNFLGQPSPTASCDLLRRHKAFAESRSPDILHGRKRICLCPGRPSANLRRRRVHRRRVFTRRNASLTKLHGQPQFSSITPRVTLRFSGRRRCSSSCVCVGGGEASLGLGPVRLFTDQRRPRSPSYRGAIL